MKSKERTPGGKTRRSNSNSEKIENAETQTKR